MSNMGWGDIDNLLEDVKDKFWEDRIKKSIHIILNRYNLSLSEVLVTRQKINPDELYIASIEECDLKRAKELSKKYPGVPAPLTVIQYRHKKVLFMGSNRSIRFILKKQKPDCIVIKFPNYKRPEILSKAKLTLKEVIERQKNNYR